MIVCVYIPYFAAAVERQLNPTLAQIPLLINDSGRLLAVSPELAQWGVTPGMPLRQAQDLCPQARAIPAQPDQYQQTANELLATLATFADLVELDQTQPAFISYLDLDHSAGSAKAELGKALGQAIREQTNLNPALGLVSGKFTAQVAAASTRPGRVSIVAPGQEATFLAPRPIRLLPLDEVLAQRFEQLGLRTLGRLSALPLGAVLHQFGHQGVWLHQLARGDDPRPVRPYRPPTEEHVTRQLEEPVNNRTILQAISRLMAAELADRLRVGNQAGRHLRLCLGLEDGGAWVEDLVLAQSTGDPERLARLLDTLLGRVQIRCGVVSVTVTLADLTSIYGYQLDLFIHQTAQENRVHEILPNLIARFGVSNFYQSTAIDPTAYLPEQRFRLQPINQL